MCCYRIGSRELGLVAFVLFAFLVVIVLHGYWAHGVSLNVRHDGGRYVRGEPLVLFVRQRDEGGFLNHKSYGFEFISHDSGGRSESIHKYPDYYQGTTDRDGDPELIEEPGFSSMHRIRAKLPLGNVRSQVLVRCIVYVRNFRLEMSGLRLELHGKSLALLTEQSNPMGAISWLRSQRSSRMWKFRRSLQYCLEKQRRTPVVCQLMRRRNCVITYINISDLECANTCFLN